MEVPMPQILYTGKLPWWLKFGVNMNQVLAWILGNTKDTSASKERIKQGYDEVPTWNDVPHYDDRALGHYMKIANELVTGIDLEDKEVLDIGCGTGILSFILMDSGAKKVVCGDISPYMLEQCKEKASAKGYPLDQLDFRQLDFESLPFADNSFDVVLSSMVFIFVPDKQKAIAEMVRVVKPDGVIALSVHGKEHYYESVLAILMAIQLDFAYLIGYPLELWFIDEKQLASMLTQAGLTDVKTRRLKWCEDFGDGTAGYEFMISTSAMQHYPLLPPHRRADVSRREREYFERKNIHTCTMDVPFGYGRKRS
jgi:ubiquinone/menaquinone biosynthesis C-methylase UbiE